MGIKICLYAGLELEDLPITFFEYLDYVKTGKYIKDLGRLNSKNTNQRLYNLKPFEDLTNIFHKN